MTATRRRHSRRIICVGNRYVPGDDLGPRVYDCLARRELPADVGVLDGGLMGLDLLKFMDGTRRVVFVDSLLGFAPPGRAVVLRRREALEERPAAYGHDGGLAYLLRMLPAVCAGRSLEIAIVGAEPPADPELIERLADLSLLIAKEAPGGESRP